MGTKIRDKPETGALPLTVEGDMAIPVSTILNNDGFITPQLILDFSKWHLNKDVVEDGETLIIPDGYQLVMGDSFEILGIFENYGTLYFI